MTSGGPAHGTDAVTVSVGDCRYRMVLTHRGTDYIQGRLADREEPYEAEMLADMAARLSPGDVVVDAGANVGNHTIYLAAVAGARVEAFEPDPVLADAIARSARLNRLSRAVRVHAHALGSTSATGTLVTPDPTNIGGQHVRLGDGDVEVKTLDELTLPRPVRMVKIDVEGMELDVLRGAERLLTADRPLLYVESGTEAAFGAVAAWLDEHGYAYWETYNATPTHLFVPSEGVPADQLARRLLLRTVRESFRAAEVVQGLRSRLDQANLKYRSSTQAYETLRQQNAELTATLLGVEEQLAAARSAADESERRRVDERTETAQATAVTSAVLAAAETERDRVTADLAAMAQHVDRYRADAESARRELDEVRQRLDHAERQVATAQASLAAAEARAEELARARDDAAQERDSARTRVTELDRVGETLTAQVAAAEATVQGLRADVERHTALLRERERERDEARQWLGERERERDEARQWLGERERERDEARHWLGERERERDEARQWLGERERERDEARRRIDEVDRSKDRVEGELARARDDVARLSADLDAARAHVERSQQETGRVRDELARRLESADAERVTAEHRAAAMAEVVATRDGELTALRAEVDDARRRLAETSTELGAQRVRTESLDQGVRSAWAEAGELSTALARHKADADRVSAELRAVRLQRDQAMHLMAAAVDAERAALAREDIARARERSAREAEAQALQAVRDLRASVTFRTGREIRRATTSVSVAATLPARLWRISRERLDESRLLTGRPTTPASSGTVQDLPAERSAEPFTLPDLDALAAPAPAAPDPRWRVAAIVDEFTGLSLEPECDLHHLTPTGWREELEACRPQLLFVESAWRGKGGVWHNTVGLFPGELRGIVEWCQARGIPTVFWNKEDPVHFSTFLTTARAFDHVFTTDIDCISRYKAALGHDRVHLLPFAAQPRTHNPLEEFARKDAISFAGSYYRRYPERTRDLDSFLEHLPGFRPVEIFDRNYGSDDPNYSFPEAYQQYVVGTLPPEEIARAYKGYRYAINLNSVKQSQTMFARRVFELLASNTVTVSNFSRGLRLLFGDLVVTTDSGREAVRRLTELAESDERLDRLRLLALRSVMSQHTYADRLAYVVAKATGTTVPDPLPVVTFVGRARSQGEVDALLAAAQRQEGVRHRMVLVLDADIERPVSPRVTVVRTDAADDVTVAAVVDGAGLVGVMHPQDHYGPHYAFDLALATRYCDADVLGKRTRYVADGDVVSLADVGAEYRRAGRVPVRSSLVRTTAIASMRLADLCGVADEDGLHAGGLDQVSLDRFSYCQGGAALSVIPEAVAEDDGLWEGLPLTDLQAQAEAAPPAPEPGEGLPAIGPDRLVELFRTSRRPALRHERTPDGWTLSSDLEDGKHDYIYADELVPVEELWTGPVAEAYVDTTPGLRLQAVFLFFDGDGERVGTFFALAQQNVSMQVPETAVHVKVGFRVLGPGEAAVRRIVLAQVSTEPSQIIPTSSDLVLTNHYPSYDNLYRNGFVHSRLRAYRDRGARPAVFKMRPGEALRYDEFELVDVVSGSASALQTVLQAAQHRSILVHFLDVLMWQVLAAPGAPSVRVVIWIHGAEVQPWWRRAYNYTDEAELEAAKSASEERLAFWRDVFSTAPSNVHFVFVSRYFAEEVMKDVGIRLAPDRYSIIHNPIDVAIFTYVPKPANQRTRILSIRPFASAKYANDLTVAAIQELSDEPWFDELEFRIIGDGALFEETLAPLRGLSNVHIERRFLSQDEIARIHKQYGVFMVPTRMDAQGVSRDEAMASGLVPLTNAVAAIPEFVDEACGFLTDADDHRGLARAVRTLRDDPGLFARLSEAAAHRVRSQSAVDTVIPREMALFVEGTRG